MPCMCGDTHCSSCGPAQGNSRCLICRAWMDDGCEHYDEETSDLKPHFREAMKAAAEEESKMVAQMYEDMLADEKAAKEYWESQ